MEMLELDQDIWEHLPYDLAERLLPWLPTCSLVRSQLVCKAWSLAMNSKPFLDLYLDNYNSTHQDPWLLVFEKGKNSHGIVNGFAYDPLESRWLSLSFSFLPSQECRAIATDKGIVCMRSNDNRLFICNPLCKTWKELPRPFGFFRFVFLVIRLIVDEKIGPYKLVMVGSELIVGETDEFLLTANVYDSETNSWQRIRGFHVEGPLSSLNEITDGVLYLVITRASDQWDGNIVGFDVQNGSWFRIVASMPSYLSNMKLMDHYGKLMVVGRIEGSQDIGIWELDFQKKVWDLNGMMPRELCDELFKKSCRGFACVGQGNLIYFSTKKCSQMLVYNLSGKAWQWMPSSVVDLHHNVFNAMCLRPRLKSF